VVVIEFGVVVGVVGVVEVMFPGRVVVVEVEVGVEGECV